MVPKLIITLSCVAHYVFIIFLLYFDGIMLFGWLQGRQRGKREGTLTPTTEVTLNLP